MIVRIVRGLLVVLTLSLMGCSALRAEPEAPALITNPDAESRAELARLISEALGGAPVTLADDALTRESELTIEHVRPRDAQGRLLNGRDRGRPEHFQLLKVGADCVLVHVGTERRWKLAHSSCSAVPG